MDSIRVGRISSIDYKKGCADVYFEDEENVIYSELPFLAFEYNMPKVNDLVLVVAQKYAQKKTGFILGPYFNDENKPVRFKKGDCLFIPAGTGRCTLLGDAEVLKVRC